jgi:prolyl-tRNA editing enzyme YbaK/EbsC (Cys-tRNA(Pro) deacylase)
MQERTEQRRSGEDQGEVADPLESLGKQALAILREIPTSWRREVQSLLAGPFVDAIASARSGTIPLSTHLYYQRVSAEMRRADEQTTILAVATLASRLWDRDSDQARYADSNLEAVRRGAKIRRLFVLPEPQALSYEDVIRRQEDAGIETRVGSTGLLAHTPELDDFVLFERDGRTHAYVAHPSIDGSGKIRAGSLLLSQAGLARKRDAFDLAWDLAASGPSFFNLRRSAEESSPQAPGLLLTPRYLDEQVITCEQAAAARGIPLAQELKTLIVRTDEGLIAVHISGDSKLSLRKVKTALGTSQAYLVSDTELAELGLSPGTVCAVLDPVWKLPHLVSHRVFALESVMTNNGTRTGYFTFHPSVLTEASEVSAGDFEQPSATET